jgi:hypothetical protein
LEAQSGSPLHDVPLAPRAHAPAAQTPERQSAPAPHGLSPPQLGAQDGAAHLPCTQELDEQSASWAHALPSTPGAQRFAVQTPDKQSVPNPHGKSAPQVGEHDGAVHLPAVHVPDTQSALPEHAAPPAHPGAQAPQNPWLQLSVAQSVAPPQG